MDHFSFINNRTRIALVLFICTFPGLKLVPLKLLVLNSDQPYGSTATLLTSVHNAC